MAMTFNPALRDGSGRAESRKILLPLLVSVLAKLLLTLVRSDLLALSFSSARHGHISPLK
jgi:hypothetical protein